MRLPVPFSPRRFLPLSSSVCIFIPFPSSSSLLPSPCIALPLSPPSLFSFFTYFLFLPLLSSIHLALFSSFSLPFYLSFPHISPFIYSAFHPPSLLMQLSPLFSALSFSLPPSYVSSSLIHPPSFLPSSFISFFFTFFVTYHFFSCILPPPLHLLPFLLSILLLPRYSFPPSTLLSTYVSLSYYLYLPLLSPSPCLLLPSLHAFPSLLPRPQCPFVSPPPRSSLPISHPTANHVSSLPPLSLPLFPPMHFLKPVSGVRSLPQSVTPDILMALFGGEIIMCSFLPARAFPQQCRFLFSAPSFVQRGNYTCGLCF